MKKYRAKIRFLKEKGAILDQMDVEAVDEDTARELINETVWPAICDITFIGEVPDEED